MDKSGPAYAQHYAAAVRWLELTVALAMVHRGDALDKDRRRAITTEILGRWRGNRGEGWTPTVSDLDNLYEAGVRWAVENTRVRLFDQGA
ncbi:MAG: hypothetical protein HRU70_08290 [Phycisphaeraceae bacterium]|nr:MAG: hypothetical protein HRU70_08290 [Phycisphaeraceae bacterium]